MEKLQRAGRDFLMRLVAEHGPDTASEFAQTPLDTGKADFLSVGRP